MQEKIHVSTEKRFEGEIKSNDGDVVDIQIIGIEGLEFATLPNRIQIDRSDTHYTQAEFQHEFSPGLTVEIRTTIEVRLFSRPRSEPYRRSFWEQMIWMQCTRRDDPF